MELAASEPGIESPSGVCWDERGRMFVTELHGYNLEGQLDIEALNKTGVLDTEVRRVQADERFKRAAEPGTYGVVKRLGDSNGDGRMDRVDVWATDLPPAYGLVPARGGVIVACAPHILYLADRDGDGRAEVRETLFTGFPTRVIERGVNAPQWGLDGWIYFGRGGGGGRITGPHLRAPVDLPHSDFRIRPDGSAIEPVTGGTGTFGFALTEAGDRFTMSTSEPGRAVAPLPWTYLSRNPDAAYSGLEVATGDRKVYPRAPAHPWRRKRAEHPGYFKYYRDRYGAGDSDAAGWFTSACSPMLYADTALPGLLGHYLVCEPAGNLIHRAEIIPDGSGLRLQRIAGEQGREFAASSDPWSHPMNLAHGPDGSLWIVDYYREIIEDYSAIPRHLQQQYGVYAGHDLGRIYRLTHRDAPAPGPADLSGLDDASLVRELAGERFWRRQTAHRLLVERGMTPEATEALRRTIAAPGVGPETVIRGLRILEARDTLPSEDLVRALAHRAATVRVHALQIADRRIGRPGNDAVRRAILDRATREEDPRVLIQCALSLGEIDDPGAVEGLASLARERSSVRWMEQAILSSSHGRATALLSMLVASPGASTGLLGALAQSIGARRNDAETATVLSGAAAAAPGHLTAVLNGLARGRKNAARRPLADVAGRAALAALSASPDPAVRGAARAVEETFAPPRGDEALKSGAGLIPVPVEVSDETFRSYVAALDRRRDPERGHAVYVRACSSCHRIGEEGHAVGPDLLGQVGLGEEALMKDLLMPGERIRPGFESVLIEMVEGGMVAGILRDDGATSLVLAQPSGVESVILRKEVKGVRRVGESLMPSFAGALPPDEVADLLAWLRQQSPASGGVANAPGAAASRSSQEGPLEAFLGPPSFGEQPLFTGNRFPNVVVATDGSVLAFWNGVNVRRSDDAGRTWGGEIRVGTGFMGGGVIVDERSGDILAFVEAAHPPAALSLYRSTNHGRTWASQPVVLRPDRDGNLPSMHMNEHGITLRHGRYRGRLLRPSRWYAGGNEKHLQPRHRANAIFSDDGGRTWETSAPFPADGTGEAAVAELSGGRIYYNSRRHWAPAGVNARRRWTSWSEDGGASWGVATLCEALPDGDQDRDYGLMAGLVRLPVKDRDILLFSNIESPSGRHHGTVWASFDGGKSWPVRRLVASGPFAYSSLDAGRPGTSSEGWIYLLYEGAPGGVIARFNLAWVLGGVRTGDGVVPDWVPAPSRQP